MSDPIAPALVAIIGGSVLAVLLFVPFVALSYRRRGGLSPWRIVGWAALLVYSLAIWSYTLLPFPDASDISCVGAQLDPLQALVDIRSFDTDGPRALLTNPAVLQLVFNVLLFMPLGFLLRTLFARGAVVATVVGFSVSLLVELTQLSGIWGLYSCAYRFFDVDDLIANTLGALLGSLVAIAVVRRGTAGTPAAPSAITPWRRLLGMLCDWLFVVVLGSAAAIAWRALQLYALGVPFDDLNLTVEHLLALWLPLLIQLGVVLGTGSTIGESTVLLRGVDGRLPAPLGRAIRFAAGIGGYGVLAAVDGGALLFAAFVIASIIGAFRSAGHRGLASALAGMGVEDARTRDVRALRMPQGSE
ncbi:VanZ like protein [Microterricola gilva]|uniref:VanZ like protein n=1 Tax=Microterricola gilva TaxID=393267 RepID=A0A4Q8AJB3_9MICO|nr:VanZ family protein [Microterricola gilva]RZU63859.1 VanZ like protein [Microterricola gilva]